MAAESRSPSESIATGADHFAVLGLAVRHDLARDDVETAYLARAQQWHPDRVVTSDAATKRQALEASAAINEAYRVLRDPVTRLEYLVKLGGIDLDSSDAQGGAPSPSQAFLIDMIERREQLADAQAAGAGAAESFRAEIEDAEEEAVAQATRAVQQPDLPAAAQALVQRRYWQRLLDEIDAE